MQAETRQHIVDILIAAYGGTEADCVITSL